MDETIFERMGKRYIGDPKSIGLPDTVYAADLAFEPEELGQKVLKKRYLMSTVLGDKYDLVATTVTKQVTTLFNVVGVALFVLSAVMLVTHFGSMGGDLVKSATGMAGQMNDKSAQQALDPQQEMLRQLQQYQNLGR